MKRWNNKKRDRREKKKIDEFLTEVIGVCKKHGMSIGHEGAGGSFIIEKFTKHNIDWLLIADDYPG